MRSGRPNASGFRKTAIKAAFSRQIGPISGPFSCNRRTTARYRHQSFGCQLQIDQAHEGIQMSGVLGQPTIARLAISKLVLEHVKGMLDLRANLRLDSLELIEKSASGSVRQG